MGPYHEGELEVQRRAGVAAKAERVGRIVRGEVPEVARKFAAEREFAILGAADGQGRVWATALQGERGFLSVPAETLLHVDARPSAGDPLGASLDTETDVGLLLIDPATRRRMRVNGHARPAGARAFEVSTREVYSNCPRYIRQREVRLALPESGAHRSARWGTELTASQAARLAAADTLFLATRHPDAGADVSHRGGDPGFVQVPAPDRVLIPDYSGNMMFNTLGNLLADERAGLLLLDFDGGGTLQLTGRAEVEWGAAALAGFPGAERVVRFRVDAVVEIGAPGAT